MDPRVESALSSIMERVAGLEAQVRYLEDIMDTDREEVRG